MEDINPLNSPEVKAALEKYSPFFKELRRRVVTTLIVFATATIIGFFFYEDIIRTIIQLLGLEGINIVFTSPFQFINLAISCGVATGLIFSFPLLIFQLLHFLKPALRAKEFKMVIRLLPFSLILFAFGFIFGALVMKWQIEIFLNQAEAIGIGNVLDISRLLTTVLTTSAFMGIGFQFPIVLLLLLKLGILKPEQLAKRRGWIYLGSFLFAILLPVDSILADILIALPMVILFEATLILARATK